MIHPLPEGDYGQVRPLFAAQDYPLMVSAVTAGVARARVYVDDPGRPSAALVWNRHRVHLAGSPHNDAFNEGLKQLFAQEIYPQGLAGGPPMFVLYYTPGWEESIEAALQGKFPMRDERQYYLLRQPREDWRSLLRPGFELRAVDRQLLAAEGLRNLDALREEMCSERESVEDFLQHSSGFCLLHGEEIVSWCLSEYDGPDGCDIGIETVEGYRRQGLATAAASALVERLLQRGVRRIGWDCWASNVASSATARKVGFEKLRDYPVYFAWFDEVDNLAVNGNMRLRARDCRGAIEWYERAFGRGEARDWAYWSAARAYALAGEGDAALGAIRQAVQRGLRDLALIKGAEELQSLHGTPGWQELIRDLEQGLEAP